MASIMSDLPAPTILMDVCRSAKDDGQRSAPPWSGHLNNLANLYRMTGQLGTRVCVDLNS